MKADISTLLKPDILILLRHHIGLDGFGWQTLLPCGRSCALVVLHGCAADQHLQHFVHRLPHREHCSYGAVRPAHRRRHFLSHVRFLGSLHTPVVFPACPSRGIPSAAANLRRESPRRNMEGRSLVGPLRRRSRIGLGVCAVHGDLYESFSLGVTRFSTCSSKGNGSPANLWNKHCGHVVSTDRTRPRAAQNPMASNAAPLIPKPSGDIALLALRAVADSNTTDRKCELV
jgi:hypothetical protein